MKLSIPVFDRISSKSFEKPAVTSSSPMISSAMFAFIRSVCLFTSSSVAFSTSSVTALRPASTRAASIRLVIVGDLRLRLGHLSLAFPDLRVEIGHGVPLCNTVFKLTLGKYRRITSPPSRRKPARPLARPAATGTDCHHADSPLLAAIDRRRDDLIALTQDLVRIPTLNPPGLHYRQICEYLAARLLIARLQRRIHPRAPAPPATATRIRAGTSSPGSRARRPATACISTAITTWSRSATAGPAIPSAADLDGDRIYGRGTCDMKGGLAASIIAAEAFIAATPDFRGAIEICATADEESGGYGGVAYLAAAGLLRARPRPARHHPRTAAQGPHLPWPSRRLVGRGRDQGRIAHGSMPFLGDCAIRHMGAVLHEIETVLYPLLATRHTAMPVVARRRPRLHPEHQLDPWRRGRAGARLHRPARALRRRPLPHHPRPPLPDRGRPGRGEGRTHRPAGAGARPRARPSATRSATCSRCTR